MTYLTHLQCSGCNRTFDADVVQTFCPECQAPFLARYNLTAAHDTLDRDAFRYRLPGMWRWHELLPVRKPENMLTLGEGDTPLLHLPRLGGQLGLKYLILQGAGIGRGGVESQRAGHR
jgi:threonine synthase